MRFEKGDIIQASNTYPCIVAGVSSIPAEIYTVWVINPNLPHDSKYSKDEWDIAGDMRVSGGIPKKVGSVHPEFVDLFLGG